jgi:hypothetical protein
MANTDQNDFPLPAGGEQDRKSANLLPKYFRTQANEKILGSTLDQMVQPGIAEKISGFYGRQTAKAYQSDDTYIEDISEQRQNRQLEPASVVKDDLGNVEFFSDYPDFINQISAFSGDVSNHSKLNTQEFYAWNPNVDWDKLANFREYFWLPNGPQTVSVFGQSQEVTSTYKVTIQDQGDNTTYKFSNRLAANPVLTLYRGQTYRFEIDTPGFPIAFTVDRNYTTPDPDEESENVSSEYIKGQKFFDADGNEVDPQYIENGVIEFTVPLQAPDHLFYLSESDINTGGFIKIFDIEENTAIDVGQEILGKSTYTSANGVTLTNGLKVTFLGNVTPEIYGTGDWYVEGVGTEIRLVSEAALLVPAGYADDVLVPWGSGRWDRLPFDNASSFAGTKDYIVVNRVSADRNPWSRYNRWFHSSTIAAAAGYNNVAEELDQSARATRPIIEFDPGLRLHNYGTEAKNDVDLVDDFTLDVFSNVEGQLGYNVDGVPLTQGQRVLFAADPDKRVNGKIYRVTFLRVNNRNQISLIEEPDCDPIEGEVVLVTNGNENAGKFYWYNGTTWKLAQEKTENNQSPRFELYDSAGNAFSDTVVYEESSFTGNTVFEYKQGTGSLDPELGFPLSYRTIENVGDLQFNFSLVNESFVYSIDQTLYTKNTDIGYLRRYTDLNTFTVQNGWAKTNKSSTQAVIRQYIVEEPTDRFEIDVYDRSSSIQDLEVKVVLDQDYQLLDVDYTIDRSEQTAAIVFNSVLPVDSNVILKVKSDTSKNDNGYYEMAYNLERNPLNNNIGEFTLGEVNDHVRTIVENVRGFSGKFPGTNNLRDLGQLDAFGRRFVQHTGPLNLASYHITNKEANIIKALRFNRSEYAKFKRVLLQTAEDLGFDGTPKQQLDLTLSRINASKTPAMPFYFTDMLCAAASRTLEYKVPAGGENFYALSEPFTLDELSAKSVLVYLNSEQLVHGRDYTSNNEGFVDISADLVQNDIIQVVECDTTDGSYIPATPTKLGLYPAYIPQKFVDNTYREPRNVIQGHDGSIVLAFDDYRDDIILEFELRVYNNIKQSYDTDLFDLDKFVSGDFRYTGYTKESIDRSMTADFVEWTTVAGNPDYTSGSGYDRTDSFTYNYTGTISPSGVQLNGYWRSVYIQAYDTDRPHTHPWEMLGFSVEPTWWQEVYGPAPYTKNNLILWTDLQNGIIREPGKAEIRYERYKRPTLLSHIPVDVSGNLLSPLASNYATSLVDRLSRAPFRFGDHTPAETAWRRSSEYPFSLITARVLNQPNTTFATGFDLSRMKRNQVGQIIYTETGKVLRLADIAFPNGTNADTRVSTSGLVNYIFDYLASSVQLQQDIYKDQLTRIDNQLCIKVGGFTEKEKFNLILDSRNPLNEGNVFLPKENYQVFLNTSSPVDVVSYSGVIVEKTPSGFVIKGYDRETPTFEYYTPIPSATDPVINIGGVSEQFVEWGPAKQYIKGQNVRNMSFFYRVLESHVSSDTFDSNKFRRISSLPQIGGRDATLRRNFESRLTELSYGTVLPTIQDVVDFMLGYEARLKEQGFKFEFFSNESGQVEDWTYSVKEFLFWTTQNWAAGSIITLSPGAEQVTFEREFVVVDDIFDNFYPYSLLAANGTKLDRRFSSIARSNQNEFGLKSTGTTDGIYHVRLPLVQKEHVILLDNRSVFDDIIYDQEAGYRQERIRVTGYRSDKWNGGLDIPGFVYDSAVVVDWEQWTDYSIGTLVKYKEFFYVSLFDIPGSSVFNTNAWERLRERPESKLIPNFDYKINQFADFYDLDSDNFDVEQQRHAQHLTGYQKRQYLQNIINDDVSQYKFYQGFIQDKGTTNSLTKLFDALGTSDKDSLEFYEEWAIRLGRYGDTDNAEVIEFRLDESKFRLSPQPVELVNRLPVNSVDNIYRQRPFEIYAAPENYDSKPFPVVKKDPFELKSAGYVREDDVAYRVTNSIDVLNGDVSSVGYGDYIWVVGLTEDWDVLQHVRTVLKVTQIERLDNAQARITFDNSTIGLVVGQFLGVQNLSFVNNNFYQIESIKSNSVVVTAPSDVVIKDEENASGFVSTLRSVRVKDLEQAETVIQQQVTPGQRVWVDGESYNDWSVYENQEVYSKTNTIDNRNTENPGSAFARAIAASKDNTKVAIGDAAEGNGVVNIYTRATEANKLQFETLIEAPFLLQSTITLDTNNRFGSSVAISPDGNYLAVGSPEASDISSPFVGPYVPGREYKEADIVSYSAQYWEAQVAINPGNTEYPYVGSQSWKQVFRVPVSLNKPRNGPNNQGAFTVYERAGRAWNVQGTFVIPGTGENSFTGKDLDFAQQDELYRLFISTNSKVYVVKKGTDAEGTRFNWELDKDPQFRGEWAAVQSQIDFATGDIVSYLKDGETTLYKAKTVVSAGSTNPQGNSTQWELVDQSVTVEPFVPHVLTEEIYGDEVFVDEDLTEFAAEATVSGNGHVMAITAVTKVFDETNLNALPVVTNRVLIYRIQDGRYVLRQVIDPTLPDTRFAESLSVSPSGEFLVIGEPGSDVYAYDQGRVRVYKQINGRFEHLQTLISPRDDLVEMFGFKVSATDSSISVTSFNGDMILPTVFDKNLSNETAFDNGLTTFSDKISNSGSVTVFDNVDGTFLYADALEYVDAKNSQFGESMVAVRNHIYVGLPRAQTDNTKGTMSDYRRERNSQSWFKIRTPNPIIDLDKMNEVFLFDTRTNQLVTYLDYIDVRQGKIAGPAAEQIDFRTNIDPARYNITDDERFFDEVNNWEDGFVGRVWWDLSTARFTNPYQGNAVYQSANWNRLIPGTRVDVYEWVASDVIPSEWDELADTTEGIARGISGQSKYGDALYSQKLKYDFVAKTFSNIYYFWVVNKFTTPNVETRTLSVGNIARLIEDPFQEGYRFASFMTDNRFVMYNVDSLVSGTDTALAVTYYTLENQEQNVHNEYQLLSEGLSTSLPKRDIERKWVDSLVGYDEQTRIIPDPTLSPRQKYGTLFSPRQSWFINKAEALKQVVERANISLKKLPIVDSRDLSTMLSEDTIPLVEEKQYDYIVDTVEELRFIGTSRSATAAISVEVTNGSITDITIDEPGRRYKDLAYEGTGRRNGPAVTVNGNGSDLDIDLFINNSGQVVDFDIVNPGQGYSDTVRVDVRPVNALVRSDSTITGRWAIYSLNPATGEWERTETQKYQVSDYWDYIDWYAEGDNQFTLVNHLIDGTYQLPSIDDSIGDVIKISNVGSGGWLLLRKVNDVDTDDFTVNYDTIGRQGGTIQIKSILYDNPENLVGFDVSRYDGKFFDREPATEIRLIMKALKEDLLTDDLAVDYNQLFFASIRYVFAEQLNVNWAFKTSFVKAKHNVGALEQRITFRNSNLPSYNDYVEEVKPYKTNVREYISSLDRLEETNSVVTDFDLPPRYNPSEKKILPVPVTVEDNRIVGAESFFGEFPDKNWKDNVGFKVTEIAVADPGTRYRYAPDVRIEGGGGTGATAQAYIGKGGVVRVRVINSGSGYLSTPTVTIAAPSNDEGVQARATAIIGESVVRSMKVTVKFDRVSGKAIVLSLGQSKTITGTGVNVIFDLDWPMDLTASKISITKDGEEVLRSEYSYKNVVDNSLSYTRYNGQIEFTKPPLVGETVVINYVKSPALLNAADRIEYLYVPTSGMIGAEIPQLMSGVDYGGVEVKSFDFDTATGWDNDEWSTDGWDIYDTTYEDIVIRPDGTTVIFELDEPLEEGVEYNVYRNGVRIDDPAYDGSTVVDNENAEMETIVGDGSTTSFELGNGADGDDVVIIRKTTSDGSFAPDPDSYDTQLSGGRLDYGNATGLNAEDIIVDGDLFVTPTTSAGPEEMVPGQVLDTVNIKVFERVGDGQGEIINQSYITDGTTATYSFGIRPNSLDAVIVKVDNTIVDQSLYTIDYENLTVTFDPVLSVAQRVSILAVGMNGNNVLDTDAIILDGSTTKIVTPIEFQDDYTTVVMVNGVLVTDPDVIIIEEDSRLVIQFAVAPAAGAVIEYAVTDPQTEIRSYSRVLRDTFTATGDSTAYNLTQNPVEQEPVEFFVLVDVDGFIKSPGYSKEFTVESTNTAVYQFDTFQIPQSTIDSEQVRVFKNNVELDRNIDFIVDFATSSIRLDPNAIEVGDTLNAYYTGDADYFINGNELEFSEELTVGSIINVYQFSNHDVLDIDRIGYSVFEKDTLTLNDKNNAVYNALRSGTINLRSTAAGVQYVWVAVNGKLLTPSVDYSLSADRLVVFINGNLEVGDEVDVIHFSAPIQTPRLAWSKFKDILNRTHYKRYDNDTGQELTASLMPDDLYIEVADATTLPVPSKSANKPGIIFVDGERIEYFERDTNGNKLRQLRRGTLGTGVKDEYPAGTIVVNNGSEKNIPYSDEFVSEEIVNNGVSTVFDTKYNLAGFNLNFNQTYRDFFEVFVGGKRLHKNAVQTYQFDMVDENGDIVQAIAPDSPAGDVEVEKEFDIIVDSSTGNVSLEITNLPVTEVPNPADPDNPTIYKDRILIVRKTGSLWSDQGVALKDSDNAIANFLRGSISKLPE